MTRLRLHILFFFLLLWAVVLVGRLFFLQVKDYGTFAAFARGQQHVVEDILPERGLITGYTINGERMIFATNRNWPVVFGVPKDITDLPRAVEVLRGVLQMDEVSAAELEKRLSDREDPYEPIAEKLSDSQAKTITEAAIPGIVVGSKRDRFYPQGSRLAHVLGFVGYRNNEQRGGTYGIEAAYEDTLRGLPGKLRGERDAQGTILQAFSLQAQPPRPGATIIMTIDANIQYQAEKFLKETVEEWKATGGSIVVLEPKTGAVRAMASVPTYDPNVYAKIEEVSVYTNPAISIAYEPGSVFKPITMAAALDSGAIQPETTYVNTGSTSISGYTISNTLQQYNGVRTMIDVLRYSLNTGAVFAEQSMKPDTFLSYVKAFGFGEPTGIELPSEAPGSLESLSSKRPINLATAAFGQGLSVTPLQLASAIGAIANGGKLMKPRIVEAIDTPDGEREEFRPVAVRTVIDQRTATRVAAMMVRVVDDGSGVRAKLPGYAVAGKTGTAQIPNVGSAGYGEGSIHSFVAFFPAFDPRYVIVTKVDRPQGARYAESTAVPLFKDLAQYLITYAAIPPDRSLEE